MIQAWHQGVRSAFLDHQFIPAASGVLHLVDGIHSFPYPSVPYLQYLLGEAGARLEGGRQAGLVQVKQATLGGNCGGLSGNFSYSARQSCTRLQSCEIGIDPRLLEDRVRGGAKDLIVR